MVVNKDKKIHNSWLFDMKIHLNNGGDWRPKKLKRRSHVYISPRKTKNGKRTSMCHNLDDNAHYITTSIRMPVGMVLAHSNYILWPSLVYIEVIKILLSLQMGSRQFSFSPNNFKASYTLHLKSYVIIKLLLPIFYVYFPLMVRTFIHWQVQLIAGFLLTKCFPSHVQNSTHQ